MVKKIEKSAKTEKEYFLILTALVVLILFLIGFYFAWASMNQSRDQTRVAYAAIGPILISNQNFSIRTSLSIQTTGADEKWLTQNKAALEAILKTSLNNTDPKVILGKNGLQTMQESMKNISNTTFKTNAVKHVYFTDFILVESDSQ